MKSIQKKQRTELKRRRRANACKKITNISKTLRNIKKAEIIKETRAAILQSAIMKETPAVEAPVTEEVE